MFLLPKQINQLNHILQGFEVAYRSIVCEKLIAQYSTEQAFNDKIEELTKIYQMPEDKIVPSQFFKYNQKLSNYSKSKMVRTIYAFLKEGKASLDTCDYKENGEVFMLAQLLDLILIFYYPLFEELGSAFGHIEDYEEYLKTFLLIRNLASHPASAKISVNDIREVLRFIMLSMNLIDGKYFWYISKDELELNSRQLLDGLDNTEPIIHNLSDITKHYKNLIQREEELKTLKQFLIGEINRPSGSVVLHGSGGVGKTALALEFCYDLVLASLQKESYNYDFILWVSSKEEELDYEPIGGKLKIKPIQPQFSCLDDLLEAIANLLQFEKASLAYVIKNLNSKKGIIVLDNYDTIDQEEKQNIDNFVRRCSRDIQFIITSRIFETVAENRIPLYGFDKENGINFIEALCKENMYQEDLDRGLLKEFVNQACGNPLVIVLALARIIEGLTELSQVVANLRDYTTSDVEIIADFMYKSMFEEIIETLSSDKNYDIGIILNVILLYDEPIDLYSLRDLTGIDIKMLEDILAILGTKHMVTKVKGFYKLDELAVKFVFIKTLPNNIILDDMLVKIEKYKAQIVKDMEKLKDDKEKYPNLNAIIEDWNPISYSEQIAMAQAYSAYANFKPKIQNQLEPIIELHQSINLQFTSIRQRSTQPYIKFQHARVLRLLFKLRHKSRANDIFQIIKTEILQAYSEAYTDIITRYRNIMHTKSFPAFLLQYGGFLLDLSQPEESLKYLEICAYIYKTKFITPEETKNRFDSQYYLAQAAVIASTVNHKYELQYLSVAGEAVTEASELLVLMGRGTDPEFSSKKGVLEIIDTYLYLHYSRYMRLYPGSKNLYKKWAPSPLVGVKRKVVAMCKYYGLD